VAVGLRAHVPIPVAPAVHVSPAVNISWFSEGCTGVRQYAYNENAVYTPLLCMKSIRKPWVRRDDGDFGEEGWYEADFPWTNLDDEGVTEPEDNYDDGRDDDDDD